MSLAQGNNTPTRPRIEPGSPDPEQYCLDLNTCYTDTVESIGGYILEQFVSVRAVPELITVEEARWQSNISAKSRPRWPDNVKMDK